MNVYAWLDYREVIKRKKADQGGTYADLAERCGIQKTYLSKVVGGTADLNSDQLYLVAGALGLDEEETQYVLLLLERARSQLPARRKRLDRRIASIQMGHLDTGKSIGTKPEDPGDAGPLSLYYMDPYALIVHAFLTIPYFRAHTPEIARRLGLGDGQLQNVLKTLQAAGILEWRRGEREPRLLKEHLQLAKNSPLLEAHQALMRAIAAAQVARVKKDEKFTFMVTFSADEGTRALIHERFLAFLKDIEPAVRKAPAKNVYQLGFDLFPWTIEE